MAAGNYGAGGAQGQSGTQGLIVITYTPVTTGALSGSTSLTFGTSGTLHAIAAAAGAVAFNLAVSGTLGGAGALSGSTSLTFALSATNSGTSPLAGTVTLTTALSGTLKGTGKLSGSTSIGFTLTGNVGVPLSDMVGSTSLGFTATGTVTGAGALSGTTSLAMAWHGDLTNSAVHTATSWAITQNGVGSSAGPVLWGGTTAAKKNVNWMPPATVAVLDAKGNMARPWYLFFKEIAETRLGGIDAETVPQVIAKQDLTNTYVTDAQTNLVSLVAQTNAITDVVNTQTQVTQAASLPGADQLPTIPVYRATAGQLANE